MAIDTPEYWRETGRVWSRALLEPEHEHAVVWRVRIQHHREGLLAESISYSAALETVRVVKLRPVKLITQTNDRGCKGIVIPEQQVLVVIELKRCDPVRLRGVVRETPEKAHDASACGGGTDVVAYQNLVGLVDDAGVLLVDALERPIDQRRFVGPPMGQGVAGSAEVVNQDHMAERGLGTLLLAKFIHVIGGACAVVRHHLLLAELNVVPPEVVDLGAIAQGDEEATSQVRGKMIPKSRRSLEGIQTLPLEDEVEQDGNDLVEVQEPGQVLHLALGYEHESVSQELSCGEALSRVSELGEPFV